MSENKNLRYEKKTVYELAGAKVVDEAYEYAKNYVKFLDAAKTEREAVTESVRIAEAAGYRAWNFGDAINVGDKLYYNNRGKNIFLMRIGTEDINNGIRITAAHIDSPRLDLKPVPLYEEHGMFKIFPFPPSIKNVGVCPKITHFRFGGKKFSFLNLLS